MQKENEPEKPTVIQQIVILYHPLLSLATDPREFDNKLAFFILIQKITYLNSEFYT